MNKRYPIAILCISTLFLICCKPNRRSIELKGVDKEVMTNWADNIIIPAFENYQKEVKTLVADAQSFNQEQSEQNLKQLQQSWAKAYTAFQYIILFDFGKTATETHLIAISNKYPTNPEGINTNIRYILDGKSDKINLNPTDDFRNQKFQGFPALDYLLFEDTHTINYFQSQEGKAASQYILMLCNALQKNITTTISNWKSDRETYINDTDNSIVGAYAQTLNAFIRIFEKEIRAMKVGYAAGAINAQNGKPYFECIEAYYNEEISKQLLKEALKASQNFFNGVSNINGQEGKSLKQILEELDKKDLVEEINAQYTAIYTAIDETPLSLKQTAETNNAQMRKIYTAIQKNVALYKTKMMADLGVQIGFQDTDGD